ncbi:hypothetical protein EK21DRAFT_110215 [Setomelanomma holmii]|uniref:Uncharacterized protein n=1 Tax=Setomelanomma holmii TaxID=210430 RepID=A0A9P4HFW5_9PLEO|nr:hypothetical protein EK21DRAFT_110215 [Setomelanomma holmii]
MKGHVNNFVNLGQLYSRAPWATLLATKPAQSSKNSVNLGRLYEPIGASKKRPLGWAYFDDGSVYVHPRDYLDHDTFEARMKVFEHFVLNPSPNLQATRKSDHEKRRLIVVGLDRLSPRNRNSLRLLARNAEDSERLSTATQPYERVLLTLDSTATRPESASFKDIPPLNMEHRQDIRQALQNFRGTLMDGVLQPNVRLGNGLLLKPEPYMKLAHQQRMRRPGTKGGSLPKRREAGDESSHDIPLKLLDQLGVHKSGRRPSPSAVQQEVLDRREAEVAQREWDLIRLQHGLLLRSTNEHNQFQLGKETPCRIQKERSPRVASGAIGSEHGLKAAQLEAKERELAHREEILRWKRRTWWLEQKLQEASKQATRGRTKSPRRSIVAAQTRKEPRNDPTPRAGGSGPNIESRGDATPFYDFDLDEAAATQPRSSTEGAVTVRTREEQQELSARQGSNLGTDMRSTGDAFLFDDFDLDEATTPQPPRTSRSRIALPTRQTLQARGSSDLG